MDQSRSNPPGMPFEPVKPTAAEDDAVATIIPYKNPTALLAYYLGLFSCFPVLGLILAIAALVLGIQGLRHRKKNPQAHGTAHAWIGVVCGSIGLLINLLICTALVVAIFSKEFRR
jgi:hypothetical protein